MAEGDCLARRSRGGGSGGFALRDYGLPPFLPRFGSLYAAHALDYLALRWITDQFSDQRRRSVS
jgi:hypothetical protein